MKEKGRGIPEGAIQDVKESHQQFLPKQEKESGEQREQVPVIDIKRYSSVHSNLHKKKYVIEAMLSLLGSMSTNMFVFYLWQTIFCVKMKLEDMHVFLKDGKVKYLLSYYLNEARTYKECISNLSYFPSDINIDSLDYDLSYYSVTYLSETGENIDVNLSDYRNLLLSENTEHFRGMEATHSDSIDDKRTEDGLNLFRIISSSEFYVSFTARRKHAISRDTVNTICKVLAVYWNRTRPIRDRKDDFTPKDILLRDIVAKCSAVVAENDGEGRVGMEQYTISCTLKNNYIVMYPFHLGFDDNSVEYYDVISVKELDEKRGETLVELVGGESLWNSYNICFILMVRDNLLASLVSCPGDYDKNDVVNCSKRSAGRHIDIWNHEKPSRRLYKFLGAEGTNRIKEFSVVGSVE